MGGKPVDEGATSTLEKSIEEAWKDVTGMRAGQEDLTFFDLKGDSISAVRLVSRIEEELGIWVEVGDIFEEDPNLPGFVRLVKARSPQAFAAERPSGDR
jgi:peptidyl carrier protein